MTTSMQPFRECAIERRHSGFGDRTTLAQSKQTTTEKKKRICLRRARVKHAYKSLEADGKGHIALMQHMGRGVETIVIN